MYDKIRALAKEKGISIPDLEKKLGLGNGTISGWNTSSPSAEYLRRVANYFSVSMEFLMNGIVYERKKDKLQH